MHRISKKYFVFAAVLLLTAYGSLLTVYAQETGGVKGKLRNMQDSAIAGATVTARQNGKDIRSATSGNKGEFTITGLETGLYNLVFDAKGYASGVKYNVEVKKNKTVDLGGNLILLVDRGSRVIIRGSVFYKDGTSVGGADLVIEKITDGGTRKLSTGTTSYSGEFSFIQPEGHAKYRITATYKGSSASKDLEVESAAIYHIAISLDTNRQERP